MATPALVGDILDQPHDLNFPKREFGQTSKFTNLFKVPGLADGNGCTMYDTTSDLAFYHLCMMDAKSDKLSSSVNQHSSLVDFLNWKDATRCFNKHEGSLKHRYIYL